MTKKSNFTIFYFYPDGCSDCYDYKNATLKNVIKIERKLASEFASNTGVKEGEVAVWIIDTIINKEVLKTDLIKFIKGEY